MISNRFPIGVASEDRHEGPALANAANGEERMVVVGSHGGRPTDAIWSLNLRAHPLVWYRVARQWHFGRARIAQGAEREAVWREITTEGAYLYYEKTAHPRIIPAVIIEPQRDSVRPKEDFA